jgi:hypothetical protein
MKLYYQTPEADAILKDGFTDADGYVLNNVVFGGVWLSNAPVAVNSSADGYTQLMIEMPDEVIEEFELKDGDKPHRVFLIPAALVNQYGAPVVVA